MNEDIAIKTKNLTYRISSLDIDEGIRIESLTSHEKIFINKDASGNFVVQLENVNLDKSDNNDNNDNNIKYFSSAEEVVRLVNSTFRKYFSVWIY